MVDLVPHGDQRLMVAPIGTHVPERLPQGWGRETLVACSQPHHEENAEYTVTQVISDVVQSVWAGRSKSEIQNQNNIDNDDIDDNNNDEVIKKIIKLMIANNKNIDENNNDGRQINKNNNDNIFKKYNITQ